MIRYQPDTGAAGLVALEPNTPPYRHHAHCTLVQSAASHSMRRVKCTARKVRLSVLCSILIASIVGLKCSLLKCINFVHERCSSDERIHVAFSSSSSKDQLKALCTAMNSLIAHLQKPETVTVHVFTSHSNLQGVLNILDCYFPVDSRRAIIDVIGVEESAQHHSFKVRSQNDGRLANAFNFIRFRFDDLLPGVRKLLYLDTDVIVLDDVADLFHNNLCGKTKKFISVAPRAQTMNRMLNFSHPIIKKTEIQPDQTTFNAGVMLLQLENWRTHHIGSILMFWQELNDATALYSHGTQPPLLLTFHHLDVRDTFDPTWNVDGLGWRSLSKSELENAKLLHWTGPRKPWLKSGRYVQYWQKFYRSECHSSV